MISTVSFTCPHCKGALHVEHSTFHCAQCDETFFLHDGIYSFITKQKQREIEPFLLQYKTIRDAEGRGSDDPHYYLRLPSGGSYEWKIREISSRAALRSLHAHFAGKEIKDPRVADIGAGNCWFTRLLAEEGYNPVAIDIFEDEQDGLRAGEHYIQSLGISFNRVASHFDELPFPVELFDAVIFNASLHYSHNIVHTLGESLRILKPGGIILVMDSPLYKDRSAGEMMLNEQREYHRSYPGVNPDTPSSSYILFENIQEWERALNVKVERNHVFYGLRRMVRPFLAWILGRRERASFSLLKITKR